VCGEEINNRLAMQSTGPEETPVQPVSRFEPSRKEINDHP
jgi:hypothetical protein